MKKFILGLIVGIAIGYCASVHAFAVIVSKPLPLTPAEMIAGKASVQKLSATELRFRALEARVAKLEAKKK